MLSQHEHPTRPVRAISQAASTSPEARLTRPDAVKAGLTPKRPRRQVENDGPVLAAVIVAEIGDITRFRHPGPAVLAVRADPAAL